MVNGTRQPADLTHEMTVSHKPLGWVSIICVTCHYGHKCTIGPEQDDSRQYNFQIENKHEKTIQYDLNIQMVIAAYLSGIGSTELCRVSSALGVPSNGTAIEKSFHKTSKEYLGSLIIDEAKAVMRESLIEEMRLATISKYPNSFRELWPLLKVVTFDGGPDVQVTRGITIGVVASVDMGWQKRSSGRRYDSSSGHMFLIGQLSKKVIGYKCLSVKCRICDFAKNRNIDARDHMCPRNFDGHAKAMESEAALELISDLFHSTNGRLFAEKLVGDDDSTMKVYCSHKGGLDKNIPEPSWLADPSHRVKVMTKPLFALAYKRKSESPVTKSDAMRLKLYIAAFIRSNRNKKGISAEEFSKSIWCTVEHLFDNHEFCSDEFCWKLKQKNSVEQDARSLASHQLNNTENNGAGLFPTYEINNGRGSDNNICLPTNDMRSQKVSDDVVVLGDNNGARLSNQRQVQAQSEPIVLDKLNGCYKSVHCEFCSSTMLTRHRCQHAVFGSTVIDRDLGAVCGAAFCAACQIKWKSEDRTRCCRHLESEEGEDAEHEETSQKGSEQLPIHNLRQRRGYYRDKKRHHVAYSQIRKALEPHFEQESIQQLMHAYDTQKNESLNTSVSYVAPKNRHLCSSIELSVRVAIIASTVSIGTACFVARILETCGIPTSNNSLVMFLEKEDTKKLKKRKLEETFIYKRKRAVSKHEGMLHDRQEEVKACENGTTYGELKPKKPPVERHTCRYSQYGCMSKNGHRTASSNSCKFHDMYMQFEAKKGKKEKFDKVVENLEIERHSIDSHNQKTSASTNTCEEDIFESSNESLNKCDVNDIIESQLHTVATNKYESHHPLPSCSTLHCTQPTQEESLINSQEEQSSTDFVFLMDSIPLEDYVETDDENSIHM